jgi:hypothetical protein
MPYGMVVSLMAVACFTSRPAWITVSEECGLDAADARQGIARAIQTPIEALKAEPVPARGTGGPRLPRSAP